MRIDKNKIVFGSLVLIVIVFIVSYSALMLMGDEEEGNRLDQPEVPSLKEEMDNYSSRVEALNELREVRRSSPPSIYPDKLLDSLGVYDPTQEEKERERMVDSIYTYGRIDYEENPWSYEPVEEPKALIVQEIEVHEPAASVGLTAEDLAVTHQEFFRPRVIDSPMEEILRDTDSLIPVRVNGQQQVRVNDRLELMLTRKAVIKGRRYPKNTLLYGFVHFKPNRVHIEITHIQGQAAKLKAFDLQDSNEGIYMRNSFRAEATNQILGDVIQDINIAGVPQVRGLKSLFARNNRNLKVTIMDQYQLILKPGL